MENRGLTYENIRISTYDMEYIRNFKIENKINSHAELHVEGVLADGVNEDLVFCTKKEIPIDAYYMNGDEKVSLFWGVVTNVCLDVADGVRNIKITAKSYTYLMDVSKKSKSFQDTGLMTHDLVKMIMKEYRDSDCIIKMPNEPIGRLVVQYKETDWEFLKRFSSEYGQGLFPAMEFQGIRYSIGAQELSAGNFDFKNYSVRKEVGEYEVMKSNYIKDAREIDYMIYDIQLLKVLKLGDNVNFKGTDFLIRSVTHMLEKGMLKNNYELQRKNGLRQKKKHNNQIPGISLEGKIMEVRRDRVKVHLCIDQKQEISSAYWFPFSTISASPDGSGWYFMPEIGDCVRVYFPSTNTEEAYAVSAISTYAPQKHDANDMMSDPDIKYLRTVHGKEIKFTPGGIVISCDGGASSLRLNKNGSISVYGQNSIQMNAGNSIDIRSEKNLTMTAKEGIDILCDKGGNLKLSESGEIEVKGTTVKNN